MLKFLMFWRWHRVDCKDCNRWGGQCHYAHKIWKFV